jgi:small subunit ribosomal protein S6
MKRPYEIIVVIRILANEEETNNVIEQVVGWIEQPDSAGEPQGKITRIDRTSLGRRKLAYEIDKQRDGVFVIFYADIEPSHISELELNLKLSQSLLRHLVVRLEEAPAAPAVAAPATVAAPVAAAAPAVEEASAPAPAETPGETESAAE